MAVEDSIRSDIEIERWTCQRSGNSYIHFRGRSMGVFVTPDPYAVTHAGNVAIMIAKWRA